LGREGQSPRRRPHPLLAKIRETLPSPAPGFLRLLKRRLEALDAVARGADPERLCCGPEDRARVRRFLATRAGRWDDGDESLVRGYLDRWTPPGGDSWRAAARRLREAARALGGQEVRRETLWFFLWEMESILKGLGEPGRRRP